MKKTQKVLSLVLAMALLLAMSATAFAATITIDNAENGVKYSLYKLFDATYENGGYTYTLMSGKTASNLGDGSTWFEIYDTNKVRAKETNGSVALTEEIMNGDGFKGWARTYGAKVGESIATGGELEFQNAQPGYYFMDTDRVGTNDKPVVITVDTVTGDIALQDKNDPIGWDNGDSKPGKVIIEGAEKKELNEVTLDEDINFDIGINVARYKGKDVVYAYVITDELDVDMTYTSGVTVKYGETAIAVNNEANGDANNNGYYIYYYNAAGQKVDNFADAQSFKIVVPWTKGMDYEKDFVYPVTTGELHVEYKAKLDSTKVDVEELATKAYENKAKFSPLHDKPTPPPPPEDLEPKGDYPEEKTETRTSTLEITKVDGDGNALEGAEFTLTGVAETVAIVTKDVFTQANNGAYWKLKDGTYTTDDPNTAGMDQTKYDDINKKYAKSTTNETVGQGKTQTTVKGTVGSDGKLRFSGIGAGTYTLEETKVPEGYNKASNEEFEVTFNEATKKFRTRDNDRVQPSSANGLVLNVTVINNSGVELPETGGIGTTIFYAAGSVLLLGAAVLLVTRRRMKTEK